MSTSPFPRPPLSPPELLRTPTLFGAWLDNHPDRHFWFPHSPGTCPLGDFLNQAGAYGALVHGGTISWWEGPTRKSCRAPGWARGFVVCWDLLGLVIPGPKTARRARWMLHLVSGARRWPVGLPDYGLHDADLSGALTGDQEASGQSVR